MRRKVIIALVAAALVPVLYSLTVSILELPSAQANRPKCQSNERQIALAIAAYAQADPAGHFPDTLAMVEAMGSPDGQEVGGVAAADVEHVLP